MIREKVKFSAVVWLRSAFWLLVLFVGAALLRAPLIVYGEETSGPRVFDYADLFSEEEEETLETELGLFIEETNMDLAVLTIEDAKGLSARDYASSFYEAADLGVGNDYTGGIFLIDMENRELRIWTEGKLIRYLTDDRVEAILDETYVYASEGDYFGAAQAFIEETNTYVKAGIVSGQYNQDAVTGAISRHHFIAWYEVLLAFVIAAACGGVAVRSVIREYRMDDKEERVAANFRLSYRKDSRLTTGNALADVLLSTYVTKTLISTAANRGGSGTRGGGAGRRSTTTRTGSGRVGGGGGRKF